MRDYCHTSTKHYDWLINKSNVVLLALLEGTVMWVYLRAQAEFHTIVIPHKKCEGRL